MTDLRLTLNGRNVRFTDRLDEDTGRFEDELCRTALPAPAKDEPRDHDDQDLRGAHVELPLQQRHLWLSKTRQPFWLMQMCDPAGRPAMQAVVHVHRSRPPLSSRHGTASKLGPASCGEEEAVGLRLLRRLCSEHTDLVTLRLQPRRPRVRDLRDFEDRARLAGFVLCEPEAVTRTLLFDLRKRPDEMLAAMSQKLRRKIKSKDKEEVELRLLTDARHAAACQEAMGASVERTGGLLRNSEWEAIFSLARDRPDVVRIVGLFLRQRPDRLVAFATAYRQGVVAEYASAGSLPDPELRKMPFNYWLLWDLFLWAREHGSRFLDLGGVTVGGPGDPMAGSSRFKRHLSDREIEIGREMTVMLRPVEGWAIETLRKVRDQLLLRRAGETAPPGEAEPG